MQPESIMETLLVNYEELEGILFAVFLPNLSIDLAAARKILAQRLAFSAGKSYPILVDARSVKSFTKEARDFLSSAEARVGVKATAILVSGLLSSTIANFFLNVTVRKQQVPTKIFADRGKAIKWLQQYK